MGLHKGQMPEQWKGPPVDHGGEPPDNTSMEARLARIEAIIPTLATKADVADLRTDMHKEFNAQTWKFVTWMTGICTALIGATYFIATHVK